MRTPEELENYFMSSNQGEGNSLLFKDFFAEIQKESYNQAIEDSKKLVNSIALDDASIRHIVNLIEELKIK